MGEVRVCVLWGRWVRGIYNVYFLCCIDCRFETPHSELLPAPPVRMETVMVERLRRKLKAQVHQTNYLRMRLGMNSAVPSLLHVLNVLKITLWL